MTISKARISSGGPIYRSQRFFVSALWKVYGIEYIVRSLSLSLFLAMYFNTRCNNNIKQYNNMI